MYVRTIRGKCYVWERSCPDTASSTDGTRSLAPVITNGSPDLYTAGGDQFVFAVAPRGYRIPDVIQFDDLNIRIWPADCTYNPNDPPWFLPNPDQELTFDCLSGECNYASQGPCELLDFCTRGVP